MPIPEQPFLRTEKSGAVIVDVHVVPNAKVTQSDGIHDGALRVRLHAPPVDGKANEALVAWLAQRLDVAPRQVTLVRGHSARRKQLQVAATAVPQARWNQIYG